MALDIPVIPALAGIQAALARENGLRTRGFWIPAFAGKAVWPFPGLTDCKCNSPVASSPSP